MRLSVDDYKDKGYWIVQNQQYAEPSFRLFKVARLVNSLAQGRSCNLLDVGCGPAALRPLLAPNISYCGMDLAIHEDANDLREVDFSQNRITWDDRRFEFVTGLGFFEYMGQMQVRKFEEIRDTLTPNGKFIMTYINFGHLNSKVWPNYNNVQSIADMTKSLESVFRIERRFPASHHWRPKQPGRNSLRNVQMCINFEIPVVSRLCALEYVFVCSHPE